MPLMPSLTDLFRRQENRHRTLFSVVENQSQVDAIAEATQNIIGGLDRGHTGLLFVVPVDQVLGLRKRKERD
jgi:hypothetical protein